MAIRMHQVSAKTLEREFNREMQQIYTPTVRTRTYCMHSIVNSVQSMPPIDTWSCFQVQNWLHLLGVGEYCSLPHLNNITGADLISLSAQEFAQLALSDAEANVFHVRSLEQAHHLLVAIHQNKHHDIAPAYFWTHEQMKIWFTRMGYNLYNSTIGHLAIHGGTIQMINEQVLQRSFFMTDVVHRTALANAIRCLHLATQDDMRKDFDSRDLPLGLWGTDQFKDFANDEDISLVNSNLKLHGGMLAFAPVHTIVTKLNITYQPDQEKVRLLLQEKQTEWNLLVHKHQQLAMQ